MNTNTMFMNMMNNDDFPELSSVCSSRSSKKEFIPKKLNTTFRKDDDDAVVILDVKKQQKKFFCKNIIDGKECPFDRKCTFAHSYEEKHTDVCNFGDDCKHIFFSKNGYCMNASPKFKICLRMHPSENVEIYHKRIGTNKKFPNVPEKVPVPDRKFTKMCRTVTDKDSGPCDRNTCTFAHNDHELIILPCRFKERCKNVEFIDGLFQNKGEKICRFLHETETKENHKMRMAF